MDKETAVRRLLELVAANPQTIRIIRSPDEIDSLDMNKIMGAGGPKIFDNYDEAIIVFISKSLAEGKEVAIQAAGAQKLMVHAARGLFRNRVGATPATVSGTQSISTESKKAGGCFVATAACGDPFAPEVVVLSAFRDGVLLGNSIGRTIVQLYYCVLPPIAAFIARSAILRFAAMSLVVKPAVRIVRAFNREEEV